MRRSALSIDPIDLHLGARLRELRHAFGLDLPELARLAGVSVRRIEGFEAGTRRMSASMLYDFAQRLAVPLDAFYDGLPRSEGRTADAYRQTTIGSQWRTTRAAAASGPRPGLSTMAIRRSDF